MNKSYDEEILVILKNNLFSNFPAWQGITENITPIINVIQNHPVYLPRSTAENDYNYKQIIPYVIFSYENTFFVMQRKPTATEQRLANKLSLGIGGHMRKEDLIGSDILSWATREFNEEIDYQGTYAIRTVGAINDDSNDVGKVHLGLVLLLQGDSSKITIKNEHKNGSLLTLEACFDQFENFESWSQIILTMLKK
jgi:predicted NUDIX family phosphoesterase